MDFEKILKSLRKWLPKHLFDLLKCIIKKCESLTEDQSKKTSELNRRGNEVDKKFDSLKRKLSEDCNTATDLLQNITQELRISQLMRKFDEEALLEMKTSIEELSRVVTSHTYDATMVQETIDYLLPEIEREKKLLEENISDIGLNNKLISEVGAVGASSALFLPWLWDTAIAFPVSLLFRGGVIIVAIVSSLALHQAFRYAKDKKLLESLIGLEIKLGDLFRQAENTHFKFTSTITSLDKYLKSLEKALRFSNTLCAERVEIMTLDMINQAKKLQEEFSRLSFSSNM
ncbi:hypothetical protein BD770DRAFT_416174 [Pilaira anomala]|nr:hypothetical protein BD770DRAFT_416174 [Pilaira anomala]